MALLKQYKAHQAQERLKVGNLWRGSGVLSNFTESFDAVTPKEVSGVQLLKSLRNQSEVIEKWEENIQVIADQAKNEEFILDLRKLGVKDAPEIAALSTLTSKQLQEYITLWQEKNNNSRGGRLFTTWDGRPMHTYTVGAWFAKFLKQTIIHKPCNMVIGKETTCPHCNKPVKDKDVYKLPSLPFHGLRHTAATMLINTGVSAKTVSGRFGHANIGTTYDIYGHYLKSADREAADKLEMVYQRMKSNSKKDTKKEQA